MVNTRRNIPAATATISANVQGTLRTRVTKRSRQSALSKHAALSKPSLAILNTPTKPRVRSKLLPTSPVSIAPSAPPTPALSKTSSCVSTLPPAIITKPYQSAPAPSPPSVSDRLSIAYVPKDGPLVGREVEQTALRESLLNISQPDTPSGCLYVCGLPGTGKTLVVSRVVDELATTFSPKVRVSNNTIFKVWVNCANLARPKDVFTRVAAALDLPSTDANALDAIRTFCSTSGPKVIIVLDEVDFLTTRDQSVLYAAFEWARGEQSRLVVVGVANALDLPTRLLPWLRAGGCVPEVHTFTPYDASALAAIVHQRLNGSDALSKPAVALAAKKVAACAGDARAVLDVVREAAGAAGGVAAVARVAATRGGSCAASNTIRNLPVQQQLALCAAANAAAAAKGARKRATLGGLHAAFTRLCARARVQPLPFADFADVCANALAHHGLLDVPDATGRRAPKTQRGRLVRLRVSVDDVKAGVAEKGFLPFLVADSQ